MATKFLRKIILEELRKVLKEEDEFGGALSGAAKRINPEAGGVKDIEAHFDQQVDPVKDSIETTGVGGVKCMNAKYIQQAIKNKLSANVKTPKIIARLSDGSIGPTTATAVNILTGLNFSIDKSGFEEICKSDVDDIVSKIRNVSQESAQAKSLTSYFLRAGEKNPFKDKKPSAHYPDN